MILLLAILLGLVSGVVRAELEKHPYQTLNFKKPGLVFVAFLAQLCVFQLPRFGQTVQDDWVAVVLVISQILLITFALLNRHSPGFVLLALGTLLNLAVMSLNGGLMPMAPETIAKLYPQASPESWSIGERLWNSKNIALGEEMTHLSLLSDRFVFPEWPYYRVAFSVGDVILSAGAFWLFWSLGGTPRRLKETSYGQNTIKSTSI